jgi:hypothetical protein
MVLRPGFFPWHDENCDMEFRGQKSGERSYWCHTHNQWASEFAKVVYVFEHEKPLKRKPKKG